MNVSMSIPTTIQVRRSRLVGLMAAVAALAAAITVALLVWAVDTGGDKAVPSNVTTAGPSTDPLSTYLRIIQYRGMP